MALKLNIAISTEKTKATADARTDILTIVLIRVIYEPTEAKLEMMVEEKPEELGNTDKTIEIT